MVDIDHNTTAKARLGLLLVRMHVRIHNSPHRVDLVYTGRREYRTEAHCMG